MHKISAIILSAGRSTRLKSATPKVLHNICGMPVTTYPVGSAIKAGAHNVVVVISKEFESKFKEIFENTPNVTLTIQKKPLGTADAVKSAIPHFRSGSDYIVIIPGDVPLIRPETISALIKETTSKNAVCGVLTMKLDDPQSYGRIIRDDFGNIQAIVEKKDADSSELLIKEVNSSIYCVKTSWLLKALEKVGTKNAQNEFYLTDIIKIASSAEEKVIGVVSANPYESIGINTRQELAEASKIMRSRVLEQLMADGVGIIDPSNTYIDLGVKIGEDTLIHPNCHIFGETVIGKSVIIEPGCVVTDSHVGDGTVLKPYSVLEKCRVAKECKIGPFARLRPEAVIGNNSKIGNFVEIKKSVLKEGVKASHLSYIGDAVVGENTNIGCGTITCNYDGKNKFKTIIGKNVFVGSDVQFVAPVSVGDGATIAAGSTVTEDVPKDSLAIARARQVVKKNWKPKK